MPTIVAITVVAFETIDVAVLVTTFCTPPMSFEIRDCTSPVRVRVKNASDRRCRWRKTAVRRSCITSLADLVREQRLPDAERARDDRDRDHAAGEERQLRRVVLLDRLSAPCSRNAGSDAERGESSDQPEHERQALPVRAEEPEDAPQVRAPHLRVGGPLGPLLVGRLKNAARACRNGRERAVRSSLVRAGLRLLRRFERARRGVPRGGARVRRRAAAPRARARLRRRPVGLMGALADGALAAGGEVVGVIPQALVERELAHDGLTELRVVESLHERKALMAELADAFVALPGGFGTLDELMEQLTWSQLGLHDEADRAARRRRVLAAADRARAARRRGGVRARARPAAIAVAEDAGPLLDRLARLEREPRPRPKWSTPPAPSEPKTTPTSARRNRARRSRTRPDEQAGKSSKRRRRLRLADCAPIPCRGVRATTAGRTRGRTRRRAPRSQPAAPRRPSRGRPSSFAIVVKTYPSSPQAVIHCVNGAGSRSTFSA